MRNKVNYIHVINFTNPFHAPCDQGNYKNKAEFRKMRLRFFPMNFHCCISFILSQIAYHALILDHSKYWEESCQFLSIIRPCTHKMIEVTNWSCCNKYVHNTGCPATGVLYWQKYFGMKWKGNKRKKSR